MYALSMAANIYVINHLKVTLVYNSIESEIKGITIAYRVIVKRCVFTYRMYFDKCITARTAHNLATEEKKRVKSVLCCHGFH